MRSAHATLPFADNPRGSPPPHWNNLWAVPELGHKLVLDQLPAAHPEAVDDPDVRHFLRFLGVGMAMAVLPVVGLVWWLHALGRTGYRKRDYFFGLVPVLGWFVTIPALWRYTARSMYWSPRPDRYSAPMERVAMTLTAGFGLVVSALLPVGIVLVATQLVEIAEDIEREAALLPDEGTGEKQGWTDRTRRTWFELMRKEGFDEPTATCIVEYLEAQHPKGVPLDKEAWWYEDLGFEAGTACTATPAQLEPADTTLSLPAGPSGGTAAAPAVAG